jgi:hypothetical protein
VGSAKSSLALAAAAKTSVKNESPFSVVAITRYPPLDVFFEHRRYRRRLHDAAALPPAIAAERYHSEPEYVGQ